MATLSLSQRIPPVYTVAFAVLAGDALGNFHLSVPFWAAVAIAIAGALAFAARRASLGMALAALAIAAAAGVSVHDVLDPPSAASSVRRFGDGAEVILEGRLAREAERYQGRLHLFLRVERAALAERSLAPASGVVRVTLLHPEDSPIYRIGDQLRVTAKLRYPRNFGDPGEFDYEGYLAREGIAATAVLSDGSAIELVARSRLFPWSTIESIRGRLGTLIDSNLDYPEREEMRALVIGDSGGIGRDLREKFALTGMAHLLVISGLHLSLVAAASFAAMRLLLSLMVPVVMIRGWGNKLAAGAAMIAVICYAAIAGHHVSTIRALVMVLTYVAAVMLDRSREVLASLALAAIIICLWLPGSTADIGFQLSFASVLAIVLGMRRYEAWWRRNRERVKAWSPDLQRLARVAAAVGGYVAVSFWALVGTAALTAYHFNQFSTVGVVANAVVVPIMAGGGMIGGLSGGLLSLVSPSAGAVIIRMAGGCLAAGTALAGWFVEWPGAWTRIFTPSILELALVYSLLLLWLAPRPRAAVRDGGAERRRPPPEGGGLLPSAHGRAGRWRRRAAAIALAALALDGGWWSYDRYFNPMLRVTFLAVGQGDGAVVRFPGSRVMLVDAGGSFSDEYDPGERLVAAYLWSHKIMHVDYLVLSHPELDHFGGFNFVARNFSPSEFWAIDVPSPDRKYEALLEVLAAANVRLRLMDSRAPPRKIAGVTVECFNPDPALAATRNNSSMMLMLSLGANRILFTGDIEARGEDAVLGRARDLHATVLKVPHHGSRTSSSPEFVEAVRPAVAVMSLGYRNRYGFPEPAVVERYREAGAIVLRTDQCGAVTIEAGRQAAWWSAPGCGAGTVEERRRGPAVVSSGRGPGG